MTRQLITAITREGQPFYDEPVYVEISKAKPLALAIAQACPGGQRIKPTIEQLSHHERVRLHWMRPDTDGGLVMRKT